MNRSNGASACVNSDAAPPVAVAAPSVWRLLGARILIVVGLAAAGAGRGAMAGDWPRFRGPSGMGMTDEKGLPTVWDAKGTNVVWKTALPPGDSPYSSPAAAGGKIFLTASTDKAPRAHSVLCYSAAEGKLLWETAIAPGPWTGGRNNGYPTPCTDGKRLFVVFGSAVVACLDFEGKIVWRRELEAKDFDVALGSSPILYGDTVLLLCDQKNNASSLIALDKATGQVKWEAARPEMGFAHTTPTPANFGGGDQLLVMASRGLQGIDPLSGQVRWSCAGSGDAACPVFAGRTVYADGGRGAPGLAVEAPADLPPAGAAPIEVKPIWRGEKMPEGLGSPALAEGLVYRHLAGNRLRCFELATGKERFTDKLPGASNWASPIVTPEGRIYFASGGVSYVLKAGRTFEVIAVNDLGDANHASPAVYDGRIFIRGRKHLWCIGGGAGGK